MAIQSLGYLALGSTNLEEWTDFAGAVLGMQAVDRGGRTRAFRMDDRKQRLIVDAAMADGERVFGWEVEDDQALDALGARLEAASVPVHQEATARADPAGNRLEAFHGAQVADTPFRPTRDISGFRTGPLGMGHVLLMVPGIDKAFAFYRDVLGFRVSDYIRAPVKAYFLHVNPRHHSLALVDGPKNVMHHLMVELYSLDDVGQCYDLALSEQDRIAVKFGRHSNDLMTSFYQRTPSDILVEYGWGGRDVDDATWKPKEMATVGSLWGHQGLFDNLADRPAPGAAPPPMPAPMRRAPVQVIDGNYERLHGVCPWWDAQRRA